MAGIEASAARSDNMSGSKMARTEIEFFKLAAGQQPLNFHSATLDLGEREVPARRRRCPGAPQRQQEKVDRPLRVPLGSNICDGQSLINSLSAFVGEGIP